MDSATEINNFLEFILILLAVPSLLVAINLFALIYKSDASKTTPYECGFQPFNVILSNFDIRYYLIAILFLLFDLEIIFLIPWVFCLEFTSSAFFISFQFFIWFLILGFYYE
jgi:NADH-quinone oxidoreductase subunit A